MYPGSQFVFSGSIIPNAPNDMIAALGKNGQFLNIVPSQNIVLIRMGDNPDNTLVPINFNDDIWAYINNLEHYPSLIAKQKSEKGVLAYPNPTQDVSIFIRKHE